MKDLRHRLRVSYLLFTVRGRISRSTYWHVSLLIWCSFYVLFIGLDRFLGPASTWILYPPFFWTVYATSAKRLHDTGKSARWLLVGVVPLLGPLYLLFVLLLKGGTRKRNRYGNSLAEEIDYLKNDDGIPVPHTDGKKWIINDVTKLNPVIVGKVARPKSVAELGETLRFSTGRISVGGGRFSMGGQTASPDSLHIDMRGLNQVLAFSKEEKWIHVQAGIRWCDIQQYIDRHNLSVKIMQSYANFTVGGALSVNAHGRYMGLGPVVLSVRWIAVMLVDGSVVKASRTENSEIFFGAIGGYNGIGIIAEACLDLADNVPVKRVHTKITRAEYPDYFKRQIRDRREAVFHNGDMYPPEFIRVRPVTWEETAKKPTVKSRLMPLSNSYPIHRYFLWAFTESPLGRWRREHIYEPLMYLFPRVHWRNYEAGYDVAELEPRSRADSTYVLLEYFVPVARFEDFSRSMSEIFLRHDANVLNISIRHAMPDPGTLLAWAREEVFAFVVYYKQRTDAVARGQVAVWTRELADAVIAVGGCYYLPYQVHPTAEQFHAAYPNAKKFFALKARLDPTFRFHNVLWDAYYQPRNPPPMNTSSEFKAVFENTKARDAFYRFLQVVFHLYPEDKFHHLITEESNRKTTDEEIYKAVQGRLKEIKPFLSELTFALPALKKQKREMTRQTLELLGNDCRIKGYVEIGSTGRYISDLINHVELTGDIFIINDVAPSNAVGDIFERGQLAKIGQFIDLADYRPIEAARIRDASVDLVTIFIGFHHCPAENLKGFIQSIHRVLRPGGSLILRDHDVKTPEMAVFVSLVHTVFNLGLNVPWEKDHAEFKSFKSMDEWIRLAGEFGFKDSGKRLFQDKDPSDNALVRLVKQ